MSVNVLKSTKLGVFQMEILGIQPRNKTTQSTFLRVHADIGGYLGSSLKLNVKKLVFVLDVFY